jgi:gamma-glutamylcyclotransferase (GGCT)/AIG2-like uncharacterized protein YtfP
MITHLFVYGTLRPGQPRWPFLAPFVTDEGHDDSADGALYDTGNDYPAARFDRDGMIHGRLYPLHLDRLDEALRLLDEVEGAVVDLFHRVSITTASGTKAWAYEYGGETTFAAIPSGNWLAAQGSGRE